MSAWEDDAERPCEHCGVIFELHEFEAPEDCPANSEPSGQPELAVAAPAVPPPVPAGEFRSDPHGTILPKELALDEWAALGKKTAELLGGKLLAFDPGFLIQVEGYVGAFNIPTFVATRLCQAYEAGRKAGLEEAAQEVDKRAAVKKKRSEGPGGEEWLTDSADTAACENLALEEAAEVIRSLKEKA